jgi:hypothetical protein
MPSRSRAIFLVTLLTAAGCGGDSPSTPNPNPTPTPTPTAAPTPAPVPPAVSNADLVLLMHMDEAAWTGAASEVGDTSGLAHHGTAVAGATTAAGRFGRAGSFPGGAGCVTVPDRADLRPDDALTISLWMNPNAVGQTELGVIAKRISFLQDSAYALYVDTQGALGVDVDTEDNRFFSGTGVVGNGRWTHVAIVYGGGIVTAYVNGSPAAQSADSARALTPFRSPLWIGCLPLGAPAQGFSGLLDEVAVWHRALSASEVTALASATGPIANP